MDKTKNKISRYDIIAILSGVVIVVWIVSDFFGGMILHLINSWFIILPAILLYLFSFFETLISLFRNGKRTSKAKLTAHGIVILAIIAFNTYPSELFKSEKIMSAVLKDDLYHYRLIFRKNGDVANQINGILGFSQTYYGKYKIVSNLIIFSEKPYDNNFIPDTILIDAGQNALFRKKDIDGNFITKREWAEYFEIEYIHKL